jgi:enamine deaminase RidA (YjgF/YER057c/UK114 family)
MITPRESTIPFGVVFTAHSPHVPHLAGDARPAQAVVPVPHLHYRFKVEVEATALI